MRWTMMDLLFVGVGWTDLAMTLNRIAVGAFFMLSGYHKLFNAERHRSIVDAIRLIDRFVEFDSLRPGRGAGDKDEDKQDKRGEWRQEPDKDGAAGGEFDQRHPPLIEAHRWNAERLEFIDD